MCLRRHRPSFPSEQPARLAALGLLLPSHTLEPPHASLSAPLQVWARRLLHDTRLGYVQVLADTPTETGRAQVLPLEGALQAGSTGSLLVEMWTSEDLLAL